jgi:hypothetical protein
MKINLLRNSPNVLNGYTNIDPYAKPDSGKVFGEVMNLDDFVDDGEAEEIIAEDIIDFADSTILPSVLGNWVKKLAHGGRLIVGGVNLEDVAYGVTQGILPLDRANALLHGNSQHNWDTRKTTLTPDMLVDILRQYGLKIIKTRLDDYRMVVIGERE